MPHRRLQDESSMQQPGELDLFNLPIAAQLFADNPDPFMAAVRQRHSGVATSYRNVAARFECRGVVLPEGKRLTAFDPVV